MSKEGSLNLDTQGKIIRSDKSLEDILGYAPEELVGKDFSCLLPTGGDALFAAVISTAERSSASTSHELRMLRKGGSTVDLFLSAYPLRDPVGETYSFMVLVNTGGGADVPGLLTEEFQRVFRFSNDAVAVTDRDGSIMDVNQAFLDLYGYTRGEVIGQNPRVLKSEHSTKELYGAMWRDILDPEKNFWKGEMINLRKDGTEVPVLLSINAIKDPDGEIRSFLGIAFDMSEKKETERMNRMYIDHIVHDLRGPLTTIMANSELLMMVNRDGGEKTKKKLDAIFSSSQKLNSMTSDILDYSRAQSGAIALRKETVSFATAFREASMPFERAGKKLLLNGVEYPGGSPVDMAVNADPGKLQRILYNLLSNAFKHAASEVSVSVAPREGGIMLTVYDDGEGFSGQDAGRIFDAYYLTDKGVRTGAAGLGLSIVKSFVLAHGGRVWAGASGAKGITIGIFIPG
ncbi:MAG: PAS domain-containing sensor histidine kinase [Deltaproteobacteria bacterium]|nr:PAS domain-containing sensor histidine kinase [Deltaproteobacteria bacterium]